MVYKTTTSASVVRDEKSCLLESRLLMRYNSESKTGWQRSYTTNIKYLIDIPDLVDLLDPYSLSRFAVMVFNSFGIVVCYHSCLLIVVLPDCSPQISGKINKERKRKIEKEQTRLIIHFKCCSTHTHHLI